MAFESNKNPKVDSILAKSYAENITPKTKKDVSIQENGLSIPLKPKEKAEPYSFTMYKKTKERLRKLSKESGYSTSAYINALINAQYEALHGKK